MSKIKGEFGYKILRPFVIVYYVLRFKPKIYGKENSGKQNPQNNHRNFAAAYCYREKDYVRNCI